MPYLNSDDRMPENPKVDALSDGAFRLYVSAMHYCARELTDGIVPDHRVRRLTPNYEDSHLNELLAGGLAHKGGEGCRTKHCPAGQRGEIVVHDYLQWNKPRAWWLAQRKRKADNTATWRAKRAGLRLA